MSRDTMARYVRHAERFGTEMVYETAGGLTWPFAPELGVRELGALSLHLQRLDPRWRPPNGPDVVELRGVDRVELAERLVAAGETVDRACRMAMVSRSTLSRRRTSRNGGQPAKSSPEPQCLRGVDVANRPTPTNGASPADLQPGRDHDQRDRVENDQLIFELEGAPAA
jgi:hypothetical protein